MDKYNIEKSLLNMQINDDPLKNNVSDNTQDKIGVSVSIDNFDIVENSSKNFINNHRYSKSWSNNTNIDSNDEPRVVKKTNKYIKYFNWIFGKKEKKLKIVNKKGSLDTSIHSDI